MECPSWSRLAAPGAALLTLSAAARPAWAQESLFEALPPLALAALLVLAGLAIGFVAYRLGRSGREQPQVEPALLRAMNAITDGFAVYDSADRLVAFNDSYLKFRSCVRARLRLGMSFEEVARLLVENGVIERAKGREEAWIAERLERHRDPGPPVEIRLDDRWLEIREVRQSDGSTAMFEIDITERKAAEASLRESEERFRDVVEGSLQGFCVHRDGKLLFANEALAQMLGYDSADEILALGTVWDLFALEDQPWLRHRAEARMSGTDVPSQYSFRGRRKDGGSVDLFTCVRLVTWEGAPAIQVTYIDLSEQKAAEAALMDSQERYRGIVEDHSEMICRYRPDGTLTFVNAAYARFFGGDPQSWIDRNYIETLSAVEAARERLMIRSLAEQPRIQTSERVNIDSEGEERFVEWVDRPLLDGNGQVVEFQAIGQDISERKAIEEALIQSEARYRSIVNDQTDPICRFGEDGILTFVNDAGCRYFGRSREELIGRSLVGLVPDADRERIDRHYRELALRGGVDVYEHQRVAPSGELRWYLWTDRCFKDRDGRVLEFQTVGRDITKLKAIEERFRAFIENAPAAISIKDLQGCYTLVNRRFSEIVGLAPSDIIGRSAAAFFPEALVRSGREQDNAVVLKERPSVREEELLTPQGRIHFLNVKFPLTGRNGEIDAVAAIHTDVTALKRAEAELADAKEEAEMANAAKTRFLSAASHDLRQPLHAMRLLLEALEDEEEADRRAAMIEQIAGALTSMNHMLNALLDIGQLESGAVSPKISDFRVQQILDPLVATLAPAAEAKGLQIRCQPCSVVIRSDLALLSRILDNFLSNALRYTEVGRIVIGCRRLPESLRIEVWDTGPGVPEDKLDAIFEDYHQLGNPGRDRSKGLGLGLAIVDRLARLLGHRVSLRSRLGKGSVFAVEVPRGQGDGQVDAAVEIASPEIGGEPAFVMVIEDDPLVANAARELLERWGIEVLMVNDGASAVDCILDLHEVPDVVIADYRLPDDETGVTVIERLRAKVGRALPAIVITGDISPRIQDEAGELGAHLLRKPVEPAKLRALLRACVRAPAPADDDGGARPSGPRRSVRGASARSGSSRRSRRGRRAVGQARWPRGS